MLIGYARVSSTGQDLTVQEEALRAAGCEQIYAEKRSGRSAVVTRLDRFARSTQDLHNLLATLETKGVGFRCITQAGVDTTTPTGKLTLSILGAVASFEADLRAERQAEGIAKAKQEGRYKGRSASIDYGRVKKLHLQGISPTEIAGLLGIGRTSVYRALAAGER
jgi:DNA invertase Pin-like site-specific DNA recombinase